MIQKIPTDKKLRYFKLLSIYTLSVMYIFIGTKHFIHPEYFMVIIPPTFPSPKILVLISGFFEIFFGFLLLFQKSRKLASWGIIVLLVSVFPANIYLYVSEAPRDILQISKNQALFRMPFQIPLIIISYWHSISNSSSLFSYFCLILFFPTIIYFLLI